jgi:hypothetical protein
VGKRSRAILRKLRDQRAKERKRRSQGALPRAEYEAQSLSKTQPWWPRTSTAGPGNGAETSRERRLTQVRLQQSSLDLPTDLRQWRDRKKGVAEEGFYPLWHLRLVRTAWIVATTPPRRLSTNQNQRAKKIGPFFGFTLACMRSRSLLLRRTQGAEGPH